MSKMSEWVRGKTVRQDHFFMRPIPPHSHWYRHNNSNTNPPPHQQERRRDREGEVGVRDTVNTNNANSSSSSVGESSRNNRVGEHRNQHRQTKERQTCPAVHDQNTAPGHGLKDKKREREKDGRVETFSSSSSSSQRSSFTPSQSAAQRRSVRDSCYHPQEREDYLRLLQQFTAVDLGYHSDRKKEGDLGGYHGDRKKEGDLGFHGDRKKEGDLGYRADRKKEGDLGFHGDRKKANARDSHSNSRRSSAQHLPLPTPSFTSKTYTQHHHNHHQHHYNHFPPPHHLHLPRPSQSFLTPSRCLLPPSAFPYKTGAHHSGSLATPGAHHSQYLGPSWADNFYRSSKQAWAEHHSRSSGQSRAENSRVSSSSSVRRRSSAQQSWGMGPSRDLRLPEDAHTTHTPAVRDMSTQGRSSSVHHGTKATAHSADDNTIKVSVIREDSQCLEQLTPTARDQQWRDINDDLHSDCDLHSTHTSHRDRGHSLPGAPNCDDSEHLNETTDNGDVQILEITDFGEAGLQGSLNQDEGQFIEISNFGDAQFETQDDAELKKTSDHTDDVQIVNDCGATAQLKGTLNQDGDSAQLKGSCDGGVIGTVEQGELGASGVKQGEARERGECGDAAVSDGVHNNRPGLSFLQSEYLDDDWLDKLQQRYSSSEQQRKKLIEAEAMKQLLEEKREARLTDLGEKLEQQCRLFDEEPEVIEDVPLPASPKDKPLPELTPAMLKEINWALGGGSPSEVLSEGFRLKLTRADLATLRGLNWLNDEVINFYLNLLMERGGEGGGCERTYAFNTFFYPKLVSGGHQAVSRWTRKVDIFSFTFLVIPVHLGLHWCLCMVFLKEKKICYYDSMGGSNNQCLNAVRNYLAEESMQKRNIQVDMSEWTAETVKDIPLQMNGSDCGMFACMYAEALTRGDDINFTQEDMPYFRNRMVYEILKKRLL